MDSVDYNLLDELEYEKMESTKLNLVPGVVYLVDGVSREFICTELDEKGAVIYCFNGCKIHYDFQHLIELFGEQ